MAAVPKKLKSLLFGFGPKVHGTVAFIMEILGLACLVVGIISGFKNDAVGLWSTEWFLIAIVLFIWGLWHWLCAYAAAKD
jgi:hypothetical protein